MQEVMFSSTEQLKSYHGFDGKDCKQIISLQDGESMAVSDEKAEKLVADFPENFEKVADGTAAKLGKKKADVGKKSEETAKGNDALKDAEKAVTDGEAKLKKARRVLEDMPSMGTAGSAKEKKALKDKLAKAEKAETAAEKALAKAEEKLDELKGENE